MKLLRGKANWIIWAGWEGCSGKRIEGAECSKGGFIHPIVYKSLDNLYKYCPNCGSVMSVKIRP